MRAVAQVAARPSRDGAAGGLGPGAAMKAESWLDLPSPIPLEVNTRCLGLRRGET